MLRFRTWYPRGRVTGIVEFEEDKPMLSRFDRKVDGEWMEWLYQNHKTVSDLRSLLVELKENDPSFSLPVVSPTFSEQNSPKQNDF